MKTLAKVLALVLLLVLLAAVGVAWYFSNLIIDQAAIRGEEPAFSNEVTAISAERGIGTITYTISPDIANPATDFNTTSIVGLKFEDGAYLQLAQGASTDGRSVTRPFILLQGELPKVGAFGQFDWPSYPNAEALGATSRDVTYSAPGGPTPATIVEPAVRGNGIWVVVAHGRNGSIREGLRAVPLYAQRGLTTMLINYRDDKKEEGAAYEDGIGNFGQTEWEDLQAAVQYAVDAGAQEVILTGWSMGGAVVASYLERGSNTDVVIGTQLDSPAVSFSDIVIFGAEQMGIPVQPLAPVVWLAERITELRTGLDFDAVEYKDNAATWPVPAAVTAATADDLVPPDSIEEFAAAVPDGEFALFEGAAHTGEWNLDSAKYDQFIGRWLDQFATTQ
jgi:hypothetical protein